MDINKIIEIMTSDNGYIMDNMLIPNELKTKGKKLCWEYNMTSPDDMRKRREILENLFGKCSEMTFIQPFFQCDYGFNIHTEGLVFINFNCVILDTSPVYIGENTFIAPGTVISCAGHPIDSRQRSEGIGTSSPVKIEKNVWIGANATIIGGVTIGEGSVIAAGSTVISDIPSGVVAGGVPCKVIRKITAEDIITREKIIAENVSKDYNI